MVSANLSRVSESQHLENASWNLGFARNRTVSASHILKSTIGVLSSGLRFYKQIQVSGSDF